MRRSLTAPATVSVRVLAFAVFALCLPALPAMAQEPGDSVGGGAPAEVPVSDVADAGAVQDTVAPVLAPGEEVLPDEIPSVLFTFWEYEAIRDAKNARGAVRPSTDSEMQNSDSGRDLESRPRPPPEKRYISLGGIVYTSQSDWIIWLNGQQITPNAIPREVMDLRVFNEYIEVRWLDDYTNQIFPIRLRPHQRFNVDTRIFLPG